jgi:tRNA U34 5-carboxymethylaminomethyl modifying GTPase MnmE/TrmE
LLVLLGQPPVEPAAEFGAATRVLRVWSKNDLCPPPEKAGMIAISAQSGEGLVQLKRAILCELGLADFDPAAPRAFTERQASLLSAAADSLDRADVTGAIEQLRSLLGRS